MQIKNKCLGGKVFNIIENVSLSLELTALLKGISFYQWYRFIRFNIFYSLG